jgi:mannose-6-phosphate isomerase-like protein (cupin superfamily)
VTDTTVRSPAFLRDPFQEWLDAQAVPVHTGFGADLLTVETAPWDRLGAEAAFVILDGQGDYLTLQVSTLPPGTSTLPQRHLYEEVVYVLDGHGSTTISGPGGHSHSFEWGPKSLFALPLNAEYRHFNASGREPARLASSISLPLAMKVYRNEAFIWENDFDFSERMGDDLYFEGKGDLIPAPHSRVMWETNFVPDLSDFAELRPWAARGAGGGNILFILADGTMHAHISEIPTGRYKKAHRHGPDYYVFAVTGHGYSLFWYQGETEPQRVNWRHGVVFTPPDQMFHQHFNTSAEPARYLATAFGSARYPVTTTQMNAYINVEKSTANGGIQIEYEEQDPRIHAWFLEELAKTGVPLQMDEYPVRT